MFSGEYAFSLKKFFNVQRRYILSGHHETHTKILVSFVIGFCHTSLIFICLLAIMSRLCVIKVSDLLRNATYADEVAIEDCMIAIPHLRAPGVSAVCRLQSTNDGMIVATLSDIVAQIDDICDLSGESYIRSVYIDSYQ